MKFLVPLLALTSFTLAQEVESIPAEKTLSIARILTTALGAPTDAPVVTDVDVERAVAVKGGQAGLLAMPDKKLTVEALASAAEPIAIGQLWMHLVVPSVGDTALAADKLRSISVADGDKNATAEVYYLSAKKTEAGKLELSLFGKDKTALVKVPLAKTDAAANTTPIALAGHKEGENTGVLVITVFGSYKADVTVTKSRE